MPATDAELIQRARDLAPRIRERAAETERLRHPHDASIRDMIEAELIQMFVPRRFGGSEASLSTMLEVVEIISAACPSTGWIAAFYISHIIYVTKFPQAGQEELLGLNGYVLLPAAAAPDMAARKVDGGWIVSGRVSWGSGIAHADWVMMSGKAEDGMRSFVMPVDAVEVVDVWNYVGMGGTGSNDYIAREVFVPDHRTIARESLQDGSTEGSRLYDNPLMSIPFMVSAYCTIVPVLTGALVGALAASQDIVARRVRNFSGVVVRDQQMAHISLGEQEIATRIATDMARVIYGRAEQILHSRPFTVEDRLEMKGRVAWVSKHCRDSVNAMMAAAGASSFHESQPLQRIWRDLNMVCSHAFWDWDATRELTGRQHLGLALNHPLV